MLYVERARMEIIWKNQRPARVLAGHGLSSGL